MQHYKLNNNTRKENRDKELSNGNEIYNCLHFRFILHAKKTGFVVEHDFIMATYLADRVIVFSGTPSLSTTAHSPQSLLNGMNRFLELLGITFRRDPNNFRPRINKNQSVKVRIIFVNLNLLFKQNRISLFKSGFEDCKSIRCMYNLYV